MSDLNLPPRRPLPPEVRERLRGRVTEGLRRPPRFGRVRTPLAAAAAVAVLAAGAVVVAQSVGDGPDGFEPATPTSTPTSTPPPAPPSHDLERCWNAILAENKAHLFPELARWRQVERDQTQTTVITSVLAAGKPIFCVTSETTVTVSDPSARPPYAAGTRTGALLATHGWIAGVADPSWQRVALVDESEVTSVNGPEQGLFALMHPYREGVRVADLRDDGTSSPSDGVALPPAPPPAVDLVDHPGAASAGSKGFLATCLGRSQDAPTQHLWHAGVRFGDALDGDHTEIVMARSGDRIGVCTHDVGSGDDEYEFADLGTVASDVPRQVLPPIPVDTAFRQKWVVLGVAPARATTMVLTLAGDVVLTVDVANGTFALVLPAESVDERGELVPDMVPGSALARGPGGEPVYTGPVLGLG